MEKILASSFSQLQKTEHLVFFLDDSIIVIWNKETLLDSWTDLSLVQVQLIQLVLLGGVFLNLAVHILYNDPCHLYPFLFHPNLFLHHPQGAITGLSGTDNSSDLWHQSQSWWQIWVFNRVFVFKCVWKRHSSKGSSRRYDLSVPSRPLVQQMA
jgi:hypothetical protein